MNELNLIIETKDRYGYCEVILTLQVQKDNSIFIEEPEMYINNIDTLNNKLKDKEYLLHLLKESYMLDKDEMPTGRYEITEV